MPVTHGHWIGNKRSRTYNSWRAMKTRCNNPNHERYKDFGGRGIIVCEDWLRFENFLRDMGERPTNMTLDRIENDKGYCKENCKWSTLKEQRTNRRKKMMEKEEPAF